MSTQNATSEADHAEHGAGQGASDDHRQDIVTVTINNVPYRIHRGRQSVSDIKRAGHVPQADELAQVVETNTPPLTPLRDDGAITLKGGEVFISYPRDSGSSSCGPRAVTRPRSHRR